MRRAGAFFLPALLLLSACGDNQPALPSAPKAEEKLTRFEFTLGDARYAISLPEQAGMRDQHDPKSVTFDARKRQRQQKIMVLSMAPNRPDQPGQTFDRERRPRRGSVRTIRYRETPDAGAGSGGQIATIEGQLEIGLITLFLYCSDQSESSLFPDWCLNHLDTLEPVPTSSGGR